MTHEAADVITKPFDPLTLPARIGEIWQRTQKGIGP